MPLADRPDPEKCTALEANRADEDAGMVRQAVVPDRLPAIPVEHLEAVRLAPGPSTADLTPDDRFPRERPFDGFVREPLVSPATGKDPEYEALLSDAVGMALQVVLDALAPAERAAFVLHDMFAVPFDEIASLLERSPAQLALIGFSTPRS